MSWHHTQLDRRRWSKARIAAFDRDNWRCTSCKGQSGRLEAHHEPPLRASGDPYDLAGITTLCRECHIEDHKAENDIEGRSEWREWVKTLAS